MPKDTQERGPEPPSAALLRSPGQGEPEAWKYRDGLGSGGWSPWRATLVYPGPVSYGANATGAREIVPLYRTPPAREPSEEDERELTDLLVELERAIESSMASYEYGHGSKDREVNAARSAVLAHVRTMTGRKPEEGA